MIGISTFCTACTNSSPMPGHWKTVSVMMANAITEPNWRPATVMTGTSVFFSAWPKWIARVVRPRARGLTTRAVHFGHALRNTLVPVITVAGLQFGSVIAFAIITETVFQWPGMGLLFVQAVQNVDIPIMAAYLLMVSLIFVTINLVVDILYTVVDPRLRSTISRPA